MGGKTLLEHLNFDFPAIYCLLVAGAVCPGCLGKQLGQTVGFPCCLRTAGLFAQSVWANSLVKQQIVPLPFQLQLWFGQTIWANHACAILLSFGQI